MVVGGRNENYYIVLHNVQITTKIIKYKQKQKNLSITGQKQQTTETASESNHILDLKRSLEQPLYIMAMCSAVLSFSVLSNCLHTHGLQPARLLCPWGFLGMNTGVGYNFLLHGIFSIQIKPRSPELQAGSLPSEIPEKPPENRNILIKEIEDNSK